MILEDTDVSNDNRKTNKENYGRTEKSKSIIIVIKLIGE